MCIVMYFSRSASTYFGSVTAVMCEHSWRWESRSFQCIMIDLRKPPWLTHFFVSKDEYLVVDFNEQQPGQKNHNTKAMGKQKMGVNKKCDSKNTRVNAEKNLFTFNSGVRFAIDWLIYAWTIKSKI